MGYMQMTLNDWMEMKQSLERELSNLKTGFIRVGYCLRRIEESKGYEQDGYKSVAEFAKAEYGLSASTVSRFMAINEKFSLDGYSERLDPKYIGFRQSIMGEMLGLPDQDLDLVTPETSRQDVRELKQFNRQEPEKGIADDLRDLIVNYFRENREELNELYNGSGTPTQEILNPSGNKVYRKGMYMMFFYTDCVKTKKFGGGLDTYNWGEFREMVDAVFASSAGPDTYANYFGGPQEEEHRPAKEHSEEKPQEAMPADSSPKDSPKEESQVDPHPEENVGGETQTVAGEPVENPAEKPEEDEAGPEEKEPPVPEGNEMEAAGSVEEQAGPEEDMAAAGNTTAADPGEDPMAAGAQTEDLPTEGGHTVAPAQIMPEPEPEDGEPVQEESGKKQEYDLAIDNAGGKLEEVKQSFEDRNWTVMSEQLLSLGFIVNQLKILQKITGE